MSEQYDVIYNQDIDVEGKPHGWIQWKGTDVCMDVYCTCGHHGHVDIDFFYHYECPKCHARYAVGQNVLLIPLTPEQQRWVQEKSVGFKTDNSEE